MKLNVFLLFICAQLCGTIDFSQNLTNLNSKNSDLSHFEIITFNQKLIEDFNFQVFFQNFENKRFSEVETFVNFKSKNNDEDENEVGVLNFYNLLFNATLGEEYGFIYF